MRKKTFCIPTAILITSCFDLVCSQNRRFLFSVYPVNISYGIKSQRWMPELTTILQSRLGQKNFWRVSDAHCVTGRNIEITIAAGRCFYGFKQRVGLFYRHFRFSDYPRQFWVEHLRCVFTELRYRKKYGAKSIYQANSLKVDFERRMVLHDNTQIHLTPVEYRIVEYLARNSGTYGLFRSLKIFLIKQHHSR